LNLIFYLQYQQITLNSLNSLLLHNMLVHLILYILIMKKSEEDWTQEGHSLYDWLQLYTLNMPLIHQVLIHLVYNK